MNHKSRYPSPHADARLTNGRFIILQRPNHDEPESVQTLVTLINSGVPRLIEYSAPATESTRFFHAVAE